MFVYKCFQRFSTKVIETETLLKKLQQKPLFTLTRDGYQLNMGLMIQRDQIFLYYPDEEMKLTKYRYQLARKNNLIAKLPKEMHEYTHYTGENDHTEDNLVTHAKMVGDERITFYENSKYFKNTDPYEKNNKLIQYNSLYTVYLLVKQNGKWQFPNISVEDKETFQETKDKLFGQLSKNEWEVYYFQREPRVVTIEPPISQKTKGIKTFLFQAQHIKGKVNVYGYEDWAWISRLEANKYLSEDMYNQLVHALDI